MGDEEKDDDTPIPDDAPTPRAAAPSITPTPTPVVALDSQLDCCASPRLLVLKKIYDKEHDEESLEQCAKCGAHWFHRRHAQTAWYSPITAKEAAALQIARGTLAYLATRPSILFDAAGKSRVEGAPTDPWT